MATAVTVAGTTDCAGTATAAVAPAAGVEGSVADRIERSGATGDTIDDSLVPPDAELSAGLLDILLLPLPVPLFAAAAAAAAASSCCFRSDGSTFMCTLDKSTTGWLGLVLSSTR